MNPLSPLTYTRRHKGRTVMLMALIILAVAGVYLLTAIFQESYVTPDYTISRYLSKFSLVQPVQGGLLDEDLAARIQQHPGVREVVPQGNIVIGVPNVGGLAFFFRLFGLQAEDMETVLDQSQVSLKEGQLPEPGSNGVALSQEVATALDLEIGDVIDQSEDDDDLFANYASIASPLEVVGILSGDVRLGILSSEYLAEEEAYHDLVTRGVLVIAKLGWEDTVDEFLQRDIQSQQIEVHTYRLLEETVASSQATLLALFIPIMLLVTIAITLVVGAINQLAFMQRLPELGTLHATGRSKRWLACRLTLETAAVAGSGWGLGVLVGIGLLSVLSTTAYAPRGFGFDPFQLSSFLLVAPVPLVVVGFTLFSALRALQKMDAVAIVERGELSLEGGHTRKGGRSRVDSQPRPLAVTTYYRRHPRRAVTLVVAMALMIVSTASLVFVVETVWDAGQPVLNGLRRISLVTPQGAPIEESEIALIEAHPAVNNVIRTAVVSPLVLLTPLIRDDTPLETYIVTPQAMRDLVALHNLELAKGILPDPNTNQVVIPWIAAVNRDLQVGDVIGDPNCPLYPGAPALPHPLVVSGIFAPVDDPDQEVWLSFMTQESIVEEQELWNVDLSLLIVPVVGQKDVLDAWLENEIANETRIVFTYGSQQDWLKETLNRALFTFSLMESIIALVAALALAGLNYIFVTQRKAEFGILNALGFSRRWLVWRVSRETLFITGMAWLFGLLGCGVVLAITHYSLYSPLGFRIDFTNLAPWFYTLPIPVAVLVASSTAVGWALSRLDPLAVIERR